MIFINLIIFVAFIFLLILLYIILPPDSPWAPWWRTNKKTAKAISKIADITKNDFVYDLGCGDGEALVEAAKSGAKGIGVEVGITRVLVARARLRMNSLDKNVIIKRKNFFDENISKASVVIVYLVPATLKKLVPKFNKELKKGTKIVSFRYKIEGLRLYKEDKNNKIYLYTI